MQFLDFLKQEIIVLQSPSVPLPKLRDTCIFFAEKAKKDTAAIGAGVEVLVFKRRFSRNDKAKRGNIFSVRN